MFLFAIHFLFVVNVLNVLVMTDFCVINKKKEKCKEKYILISFK